jgi:hypothetical protein
MREQLIDFKEACKQFDAVFITTNSTVTARSNKAVMGAGIAGLAREMFTGIDEVLARELRLNGNVPNFLGIYQTPSGVYFAPGRGVNPAHGHMCELWSFPTKHDVREDCDIRLIVQSAKLAAFDFLVQGDDQVFRSSTSRLWGRRPAMGRREAEDRAHPRWQVRHRRSTR